MSKLTLLARGKPCTVRLPGCDGGGETTVGAHYRSLRYGAGTAIKPNDYILAWCCASCHDAVDGRRAIPAMTRAEIRAAHAEGVLETICHLHAMEII
jgi:hypothetical protein